MKIKQLLILCIILLLLPFSFSLAQGDVDKVPTVSEVMNWVTKLDAMARTTQPINAPITEKDKTEFGYAFEYNALTLYYSQMDLTNADILALQVTDSTLLGPRGEMCFDYANVLFEKYPNDNIDLVGDKDMASLYIKDQLPQNASWGIVLRNGQSLSTVEYNINEPVSDGMYTDIKLSFDISDGRIYSIGVFNIQDLISFDELSTNINNIKDISKVNTYHAFKTSSDGSTLDAFQREDLNFSGIDMLMLNPQIAIDVFGKPDTDASIQDETGMWYRTMSWDGITLVFMFDSNKQFVRCEKISINSETYECSRGVKIGDSFTSVFTRFKSGKDNLDENMNELLYGDGINAPYGVAHYSDNGTSLDYAVDVELSLGNKICVVLRLNFIKDNLNEIIMYVKQ